MPSVTGAPVTRYKVRTWVCLNHEILTLALELQIYNVGITLELRLVLCGGQAPISTMKKNLEWAWPLSKSVALDTQPKTTIMSAYLFFNKEHKVLICKVHQYAVSPKFLYRHFLTEHELDIGVRQDIITYASQFTVVEMSQLTYSTDKVIPVPYLSIVNGFKCQYVECDKVLGTLFSVKKHCRAEHNWKANDGAQWLETRAQTFCQGNDKRYVC